MNGRRNHLLEKKSLFWYINYFAKKNSHSSPVRKIFKLIIYRTSMNSSAIHIQSSTTHRTKASRSAHVSKRPSPVLCRNYLRLIFGPNPTSDHSHTASALPPLPGPAPDLIEFEIENHRVVVPVQVRPRTEENKLTKQNRIKILAIP